MKTILAFLLLAFALPAHAQKVNKDTTLRAILLQELRTTHTQQEWFVPLAKALKGVTVEQATWKPSDSSHSIAQLATHLLFWNKESLNSFYGIKNPEFSGNNDETFAANMDKAKWETTLADIIKLMADWEKAVTEADEPKLKQWASTIQHIGTHNAYHIGQIMYVRKLQGAWDAAKGVK